MKYTYLVILILLKTTSFSQNALIEKVKIDHGFHTEEVELNREFIKAMRNKNYDFYKRHTIDINCIGKDRLRANSSVGYKNYDGYQITTISLYQTDFDFIISYCTDPTNTSQCYVIMSRIEFGESKIIHDGIYNKERVFVDNKYREKLNVVVDNKTFVFIIINKHFVHSFILLPQERECYYMLDEFYMVY